MADSGCPLCIRELKSGLYYEDDLIWVVDCVTCQCPLAVVKRHIAVPTEEEMGRINKVFDELRVSEGRQNSRTDCNMRAIPAHFHCHLRS